MHMYIYMYNVHVHVHAFDCGFAYFLRRLGEPGERAGRVGDRDMMVMNMRRRAGKERDESPLQ